MGVLDKSRQHVGERIAAGAPATRIRYEDDVYGWAKQQAALILEGRFGEIDTANVADEINGVSSHEYDKLVSALTVLLMHMLKWDHQSELRSRSWAMTIREQRRRVSRSLRKNPSLKSVRDEAIVEAYEDARDEASAETGLDLSVFPEPCPYTFAEMQERPFDWPLDRISRS